MCHEMLTQGALFTPRRACVQQGQMIAVGLAVYYVYKKIQSLAKYSLSEVHSNPGRLLFEFNHLQYTLAVPEVFVAFENPSC